MKGHANVGLK